MSDGFRRHTAADVIVVGGGVAGLVAARRLALNGGNVTVLESADRLGGQVWRHRLGGVELDAGADSFATRDGTVSRLLTDLGMSDRLVLPRPAPAWVHRDDGSAAPLPATGLLGIPGDPLAADVIRSIGLPAAIRARADAVLPARIGADAATLGELVRRRMGRGVLEGLVAPVVRGVHSRHPDDVATDAASPRLRALLHEKGSLAAAVRAVRAQSPAGSQVAGVEGGIFRLVDELAAACERLGVAIRTSTAVGGIRPDGVTADGREVRGRVLLAAPDPADSPCPHRRLTLVTLVVVAPQLDSAPRGTGVLVSADAPGVTARALTHLSAKWQWIADALPGRHALRLSYDGDPADAISTARHDAEVLLGVGIDRVLDADSLAMRRPSGASAEERTDVAVIGESVSGTGLAAVIARAERVASTMTDHPVFRSATVEHDSPSAGSGGRMEG